MNFNHQPWKMQRGEGNLDKKKRVALGIYGNGRNSKKRQQGKYEPRNKNCGATSLVETRFHRERDPLCSGKTAHADTGGRMKNKRRTERISIFRGWKKKRKKEVNGILPCRLDTVESSISILQKIEKVGGSNGEIGDENESISFILVSFRRFLPWKRIFFFLLIPRYENVSSILGIISSKLIRICGLFVPFVLVSSHRTANWLLVRD